MTNHLTNLNGSTGYNIDQADVLVYYDQPLVAFVQAGRQAYLMLASSEDVNIQRIDARWRKANVMCRQQESFLFIPVSLRRKRAIKNGCLTLRQAILRREGQAFLQTHSWVDDSHGIVAKGSWETAVTEVTQPIRSQDYIGVDRARWTTFWSPTLKGAWTPYSRAAVEQSKRRGRWKGYVDKRTRHLLACADAFLARARVMDGSTTLKDVAETAHDCGLTVDVELAPLRKGA